MDLGPFFLLFHRFPDLSQLVFCAFLLIYLIVFLEFILIIPVVRVVVIGVFLGFLPRARPLLLEFGLV